MRKTTRNEFAYELVRQVANKRIKVRNTWEGKEAQRQAYVKAQQMINQLVKTYGSWVSDLYIGIKEM